MPQQKLDKILTRTVEDMASKGIRKHREKIITRIIPASGNNGPRYYLADEGDKPFLRMNSNNYLGLSLHNEVRVAEDTAISAYGTGPGAVRFISGTWQSHVNLEQRLAKFHEREAGMIFSSAYAAMMGLLPQLISDETAIISDELNHNCIINAIRLARPKERYIYPHLDMDELEAQLQRAVRSCRRVLIVSDGIFSMRGDHAPLDQIMALAKQYDELCAENVLVVIDDSHGVGAFGETGRGTEEYTHCDAVDILVATLGKAFGVNGGYIVASQTIVDYLRETSPFYIYSNPITPGEAAAAEKSLDIVDSQQGRDLLVHLSAMTERFKSGLISLGFETLSGEHPVVPLLIRDTAKTSALVAYLYNNGVLATGLNHPVVPAGDEEIRFQICADHTANDIDYVLQVLRKFVTE